VKLNGDKNIPKWFIFFIALWAILVGEIIPVCLENLNCFPAKVPPGGKESMFSGPGMLFGTVVFYLALSTSVRLLFKWLNWKIVSVLAILIGIILEFVFFRPQESGGPNVEKDPLGSIIFFAIIWPVLLVAPYGLYKLYLRKN